MKIEKLKKYIDKQVAILGYGKEGKASLAFLEKLGFTKITILDKENLKIEGYNVISGENYLKGLDKYSLIFKTPGISPYKKELMSLRDRIVTGAAIFFDNYEGKVIGITATKGKSTTSTLCYETLKKAGLDVKLVGNIGNPILEEIDILSGKSYEYVVYELSSYMLEEIKPKCFIGVLGNIYPCHVDWHNNDFNTYKQAKLKLIKYSQNVIVNSNFKELVEKKENVYISGEKGDFYFDVHNFYTLDKIAFNGENILIKGDHNKKNISSAIGINYIIEQNNNKIQEGSLNKSLREALNTFGGLPHRLENVGIYNGITFIDDGISTTPESTIEAIKTFSDNIGVLMLGGEDSGFTRESYDELIKQISKSKPDNIILFPNTGNDIFTNETKDLNYGDSTFINLDGAEIQLFKTNNMHDAIKFVFSNCDDGKICLMSNAAPSYSLWKNYIEKGEDYKNEIIKQVG